MKMLKLLKAFFFTKHNNIHVLHFIMDKKKYLTPQVNIRRAET